MEIVLPIVTLILGTLLGAWFNRFLARPKLVVTGSGGGGGPGPGFHRKYVHVANQPGLLGVRLSESVFFGKRIHGRIEKGLTIDRNPANECIAHILDKETGRQVAPLWWEPMTDSDVPQRKVTIRSGERETLQLFARLDSEATKYFVYQPEGNSRAPKVPSDEVKFHDSKDFVVQIRYSYGRQKLTFAPSVRKDWDGRLYVESGGGGGSF